MAHYCIRHNTPIFIYGYIYNNKTSYGVAHNRCALSFETNQLVGIFTVMEYLLSTCSILCGRTKRCWHVSLISEHPVSLAVPNLSKICTFDA